MSEFLAGFLAGVFSLAGIAVAVFAYASFMVGGRADTYNPYDPEAR